MSRQKTVKSTVLYSETACQICGVSFNIGRVRTIYEPSSAGWEYTGSETHSLDPLGSRCMKIASSGCSIQRGQHIAGPGCSYDGGYNGSKITVAEMRGMMCPRYILRKPSISGHSDEEEEEEQEEGGNEYEKESRYFLSSETITPPCGAPSNALNVAKYHINYDGGGEQKPDSIVSVHDACWKIFGKVSMRNIGKVDLDGFVRFWQGSSEEFGFSHEEGVARLCRQKWWSHRRGTEFLAANPVDIPGFHSVMQGFYQDEPRGDAVFDEGRAEIHDNQTDPFGSLPPELKSALLGHLHSKDIGSLRLASRSFKQLPKSVFRHLIIEEIPWFWEIDQLKADEDEYCYQSFVENGGEDILEMGIGNSEWLAYVKDRMERKPIDTNWYNVYRQLKIMEKGVLGVRNRARIWKIAESIIRGMERMKGLPSKMKKYGTGHGQDLSHVFPHFAKYWKYRS